MYDVRRTVHKYIDTQIEPGDLVVVNTSGTLAAALDATGPEGLALTVHLSTRLPADLWVVEVRMDSRPFAHARIGAIETAQAAGMPGVVAVVTAAAR